VSIARSSAAPPFASTSSSHEVAVCSIHEAFVSESREHVAREGLIPLIAVIGGVVSDEVTEARLEVRAFHVGERIQLFLELFEQLGAVESRGPRVELLIEHRKKQLSFGGRWRGRRSVSA